MSNQIHKQPNKINFEKLRKLAKKIKEQTEEEARKYPQLEQLKYGNRPQSYNSQ